MGLTIKGLQEAQAANLKNIAALKPNGAFGRAVQYATIQAQRYAVSITHVDTGSLRASHRMQMYGNKGEIFIDPNAVNPRSRSRPVDYGVYEHKRGGSHAFYARTEQEAGPKIANAAVNGFIKELA
jgi:hypothetical protein